MTLSKWDIRWLLLAKHISSWSKDPRTKVGAVLVKSDLKTEIAFGYNGFPECIPDDEDLYEDRELKNKLVLHAEQNALSKVAHKSDLVDSSVYIYPVAPCGDCCKLLIANEVSRIVGGDSREDFVLQTKQIISYCDKPIKFITYNECEIV